MLALACAGAVLAGQAAAQVVAGTAVEADGGRVVPSAVVTLLDHGGREVARTLSDRAGRFVLRAPGPGSYTLKIERVGHASTVSPLLTLAAHDSLDYRLHASRERVVLAGIVARGRSRCVPSARGGPEVVALWDEARKALRGTSGTELRGYHYLVRRYRRPVRVGDEPPGDSAETVDMWMQKPFASVPPEVLARGWVQRGADSTRFLAPDAEVMASPSFVESHCFRVVPPGPEESGLVGLAFEPMPGARLADIRGVLWLDARSAELRRVDFGYTGLDLHRRTAEQLGGRVEFRRLPDGAWIVSRWRIRLPAAVYWMEAPSGVGQRPVVRALRDEGGEIIAVRTDEGAAVPLDASQEPAPDP